MADNRYSNPCSSARHSAAVDATSGSRASSGASTTGCSSACRSRPASPGSSAQPAGARCRPSRAAAFGFFAAGHRANRPRDLDLRTRQHTATRRRPPTLFLVYSALNGIMFSFILLAYTKTVDRVGVHHDGRQCSARSRVYGTMTKRSLAGHRPVRVHGAHRHRDRVDRRHLLAERHAAVHDFRGRRDRVHRPHRLRRPALKAMALQSRARRGVVRDRGRARAVPRLHQPVLDDPAAHRRPAPTNARRRLRVAMSSKSSAAAIVRRCRSRGTEGIAPGGRAP